MTTMSKTFQAMGIASLLALSSFSGSVHCQAAADDANSASGWQQAALSGYKDFSEFRQYLSQALGSETLDSQETDMPIGWVSFTLTPDGEVVTQFELPPYMEGATFGSGTIQDFKDSLENADLGLGTLTDVSYSVSNPGALDFSFTGPDDGNYDGDLADGFRQEAASALDVDLSQVGDFSATLGSSKISLQFQVLPESCTFAEGEVDRIESALQSGSLGDVDTIIYDSSDCGHIDALLTMDNTEGDGNTDEQNYFYSRVAADTSTDTTSTTTTTTTTTTSSDDVGDNSGRRLHRRLQQWYSGCESHSECASGFCMAGGYCA